jgi:hypothetical protein
MWEAPTAIKAPWKYYYRSSNAIQIFNCVLLFLTTWLNIIFRGFLFFTIWSYYSVRLIRNGNISWAKYFFQSVANDRKKINTKRTWNPWSILPPVHVTAFIPFICCSMWAGLHTGVTCRTAQESLWTNGPVFMYIQHESKSDVSAVCGLGLE